jgi:AcrR family transcriptional regulator
VPEDHHEQRHRRAHERAERHRARALEHRDRMLSRRERRHLDTRDEILTAAREVLLERGAAELSLREIARRAGFTPGALYKYFDNKNDLVRALADGAMGALVEAFGRVPSGLPPDERAVEMGMAYLGFARTNPEDVAVIVLHESTAHALPPTAEYRGLEEAVKGVFREGVAQGVFAVAVEDVDYVAFGAWALVQGLAAFEKQQRPELAQSLRGKQRHLLSVYINGLKSDLTAPDAGGH